MPNVRRAINRAKWSGPLLEVPYPGRWARNRKIFLETMLPHLRMLLSSR
jgi:hypothetical protein